eukprot:TRINITY_DN13963_c0_g1_i1.p1 TRINITY_DN13963_c0_g1~~TRINITY_DN13963_c0_g1_i1.p1  ORF type:complete len:350 (+),score=48.67 TRINITY_DN13963_c0_g1_i1:253-1302(+)
MAVHSTVGNPNFTALLLFSSVLLTASIINGAYAGKTVPAAQVRTFGTAISSAPLTHNEQELFLYNVVGENGAAITHWWFTGGPEVNNVRMRFYIDGETTASIDIPLDYAAGIGFDDQTAPWGTEMIGKGATSGGVFNNIRIPFFKTIRITCQQPTSDPTGTFWWIVRGAEGVLPITIGNVELPATAKLSVMAIRNVTYSPLDIIDVATVTKNGGALAMWTLSVASGTINFIEGCVRCYIDKGPKMLLSSGTEDYFDSAFTFNAGPFRLPVSGCTHIKQGSGPFGNTMSAYRFHNTDPIIWHSDFVLQWRNGDTLDPKNGQKCIDDSGTSVGRPAASMVNSFVWLYHYAQ